MGKIDLKNFLKLSNLGVLIVDMQIRFINEINNDDKEDSLIENQENILNYFDKKLIPVCLISRSGIGKNLPSIENIVNNFKNKLICEKFENDAFTNPLVYRFFNNHNVKNLLIMGLNASVCVKETSITAKRLNYNIFTSSRLIADYGSLKHNLSMKHYQDIGKIIDFS